MANYSLDYMTIYGGDLTLDGTQLQLQNPSFEDADGDVEWRPENWTPYTESYGLDWLPNSGTYGYAETFEGGYSSNEDSLDAFSDSDLEDALFGTALEHFEDYEQEWSDNENWLEELPASAVPATFDAAADEFEDYEEEWPARHPVADSRYIDDTWGASVYARSNEIKAVFNEHAPDTAVHVAGDSTHPITSADAFNLATAIVLCTELWDDVWPHILDTGLDWHLPDSGLAIPKPDATNFYPPTILDHCYKICRYLANALDLHFTWASNVSPGYVEEYELSGNVFTRLEQDFKAAPYQEKYESGWDDNENSLTSFQPSDLDMADFETRAGGTEEFDSYEEKLSVEVILSAGSAGEPTYTDPTARVRLEITGTLVGDLRAQTRRKGSPTWIERGQFTTLPANLDLEEGHEWIRIYTEAYTSGTPMTYLTWTPLE